MGKRGPAPKPTRLRILHADRADRINTAEPAPPEQQVEPPDWLDAQARQIWDRLAPGLIARGVLTVWDVDAMTMLCEALSRYAIATQFVHARPLLEPGPGSAGLVPAPALKVQADAERAFLVLAARFGLTPSDRQSIKVEVAGDGTSAGGTDRLLS